MSKELDKLYEQITDLLDDLSEVFDDDVEQGEIAMVKFFYETLEKKRIMQHAIDNLLPYKNKIMNKDVDFFKNNMNIFQGLPEDRIEHYTKQILGNRLSEDDRDIIWEYLKNMVILAERYKKIQ